MNLKQLNKKELIKYINMLEKEIKDLEEIKDTNKFTSMLINIFPIVIKVKEQNDLLRKINNILQLKYEYQIKLEKEKYYKLKLRISNLE